VAEALSRTPQPTQVEIAQELGISDRSVRRYRDELLVNGRAAKTATAR
jgi:predicted transcriptional regulator